MIILDYSPFANTKNDIYKGLNSSVNPFKKVFAQNAIFDEIHIIENTSTPHTPVKREWDFDTVFLWKGDSIEAGNVGLQGIPITDLKIKRRKKGESTFEDIRIIKFNPEQSTYHFEDNFVESYEEYVYGIQAMGGSIENPVLGETAVSEISTSFESAWLVGKDQTFQLLFNLEVGDYENVVPTEVFETLGNRYPIISSNGNIRYKRGSLTCTLLSDKFYNGLSPKEEKLFRNSVIQFLTDKKPKLFKDGSGEYMLISIIGNPTLSPHNNMNQLVYNLSIEFVEVGNGDIQNLIDNDLLVIRQ